MNKPLVWVLNKYTYVINNYYHIFVNRCECGNCAPEANGGDCRCCTEGNYFQPLKKLMQDQGVGCITQHPGFEVNCLNTWALDAAYTHLRARGVKRTFERNEYVTISFSW